MCICIYVKKTMCIWVYLYICIFVYIRKFYILHPAFFQFSIFAGNSKMCCFGAWIGENRTKHMEGATILFYTGKTVNVQIVAKSEGSSVPNVCVCVRVHFFNEHWPSANNRVNRKNARVSNDACLGRQSRISNYNARVSNCSNCLTQPLPESTTTQTSNYCS